MLLCIVTIYCNSQFCENFTTVHCNCNPLFFYTLPPINFLVQQFYIQCIIPENHVVLFVIGDYWVDPDKDCKKNAIVVFCNFERKQTCVYPTKQTYEPNTGPVRAVVFFTRS